MLFLGNLAINNIAANSSSSSCLRIYCKVTFFDDSNDEQTMHACYPKNRGAERELFLLSLLVVDCLMKPRGSWLVPRALAQPTLISGQTRFASTQLLSPRAGVLRAAAALDSVLAFETTN